MGVELIVLKARVSWPWSQMAQCRLPLPLCALTGIKGQSGTDIKGQSGRTIVALLVPCSHSGTNVKQRKGPYCPLRAHDLYSLRKFVWNSNLIPNKQIPLQVMIHTVGPRFPMRCEVNCPLENLFVLFVTLVGVPNRLDDGQINSSQPVDRAHQSIPWSQLATCTLWRQRDAFKLNAHQNTKKKFSLAAA